MPIPDYQKLMLPLLRRVGEHPGTARVRDRVPSVADEFALTEPERAQRIPSGQDNLLTNRLFWARTYLVKVGLLAATKREFVEITPRGRDILSRAPKLIDNRLLSEFPEFAAWAKSASQAKPSLATHAPTDTKENGVSDTANVATPRERIDGAIGELNAALTSDLLERVRVMHPSDFEDLIIRLLLAMGYGQGLEEMAEALGGSGYGGIDGVIHEDPLGLERVYIQAKRYKEGSNVASGDVRNFIGALNIKRASKGVFVTASDFTPDARATARDATVQVVLIDSVRLADLMVKYKVGVLVRTVIELKEIDEGFFEA